MFTHKCCYLTNYKFVNFYIHLMDISAAVLTSLQVRSILYLKLSKIIFEMYIKNHISFKNTNLIANINIVLFLNLNPKKTVSTILSNNRYIKMTSLFITQHNY